MPNYCYNSQDYMRRCGGRNPMPGNCPDRRAQEGSDRRGCAKDPLGGLAIAMAYVPWQEWRKIYEARQGFCCGTIFEELNKPFQGTGGCRR